MRQLYISKDYKEEGGVAEQGTTGFLNKCALAYLRPQNTLSSAHFCHNNFKSVLCTEESASLATSNSIKSKNNGYWPDIFVCNNCKDFF